MANTLPTERYRGFVIDLDGVVYLLDDPIPGSIQTLKALQSESRPFVFLTNNSSSTAAQYVRKLQRLGIEIAGEQVVTSSEAVRCHLENSHQTRGSTALVIGETGLLEEMARTGLDLVGLSESLEADYVIVGWDREFNFDKLRAAVIAIRRGAEFIASNLDATYPTPQGLWPGAGSIIAAVATGAGREPFVAGKPNPLIVNLALERLGLGPGEVLLIGDRLDTDIEAGLRAGVDTLLVLTGISTVDDIERTRIEPTHVMDSLSALLDQFEVR